MKNFDWQAFMEKAARGAEGTFWEVLGCKVHRVDETGIAASMFVQPMHLNHVGYMHGGVHATALDSIMGVAASAALYGEAVVTTQLTLHYILPVYAEEIRIEAEPIEQSRRSITVQGRILNGEGSVAAAAIGSFRIITTKAGDRQ